MKEYTSEQYSRAESRVVQLKEEWLLHDKFYAKAKLLESRIESEMELSAKELHVLFCTVFNWYMIRRDVEKKWQRALKRYKKIADALGVNVNGFWGLTLKRS